jgi:pyruvate/2-oxoglutarate dehydrogenase complex dihydrolipoamide dehydrogenase (E3) component
MTQNDQDVPYRLFKIPMGVVLRTRSIVEPRGFLSALVGIDRDRILGFTAFDVGPAEIMAAVQIAMITGLPYTSLRDAILARSTLAESPIPLFSSEPCSLRVS